MDVTISVTLARVRPIASHVVHREEYGRASMQREGMVICRDYPRQTHLDDFVFIKEDVFRPEVMANGGAPWIVLAYGTVTRLRGDHHLAQQVPQEQHLRILSVGV